MCESQDKTMRYMTQSKEHNNSPDTDPEEREVSYLTKFKITIMRCFMSSRTWHMNKMRIATKRKYKGEPNRNFGAEKHNNWTRKLTRGVKSQPWSSRRKYQ